MLSDVTHITADIIAPIAQQEQPDPVGARSTLLMQVNEIFNAFQSARMAQDHPNLLIAYEPHDVLKPELFDADGRLSPATMHRLDVIDNVLDRALNNRPGITEKLHHDVTVGHLCKALHAAKVLMNHSSDFGIYYSDIIDKTLTKLDEMTPASPSLNEIEVIKDPHARVVA